ncbi:LamG domain-containing protein [Marinicella sp. W31]|uniref:LamG domain-containing protein n=1 Tax=Marinicella sp. W31 TaxID=3023713 RepID=UPI0037568165
MIDPLEQAIVLYIRMISCLLLLSTGLMAQSNHALKFYATGVGPPGQQDRILIPVDDNQPGKASSVIDVGTGDFTFEFWLRGRLQDNPTNHAGGGMLFNDYNWIEGNIILDRDVWCGTERNFGLSVSGGKVRFGVGEGDAGGSSSLTIEGNRDVLDDSWHHVAAVRDVTAGSLRIVVDGVLDFSSPMDYNRADLSYPDAGIPVTGDCSTGQLTAYGWYLVIAAEKHDAGSAYPSFNGYLDELRIWNTARSVAEIRDNRFSVVSSDSVGLVAQYRFEEGMGTTVADSSDAQAPDGQLIAGINNNGEWVSRADNSDNTAPLSDVIFANGFE